jgi:predicted RNase H-like HicB family nuclease
VPLGRHIIETTERVEKLPRIWTEELRIGSRTFHVRLTGAETDKGFCAHCLELPGTLEQGATSEEAVQKLKDAVETVLAYMKRESGGMAVAKRVTN